MKIFSWMQNKLSGKQGTNKSNLVVANKGHKRYESCQEEFSDWPNGLLAIGTFGNSDLKDSETSKPEGSGCSFPEHPENDTPEELHKESPKQNPLLDKFFDCPQSLEDESTKSEQIYVDSEGNQIKRLQRSTSVVLGQGKDIHLNNSKSGIGKKSLSFLLKNTFFCRHNLPPSPRFREALPLPELKFEQSRTEKILRAILKKKIYPQSSNPEATAKKYLDSSHTADNEMIDSDDETIEDASEGSKWVKTDSEYIVLEI